MRRNFQNPDFLWDPGVYYHHDPVVFSTLRSFPVTMIMMVWHNCHTISTWLAICRVDSLSPTCVWLSHHAVIITDTSVLSIVALLVTCCPPSMVLKAHWHAATFYNSFSTTIEHPYKRLKLHQWYVNEKAFNGKMLMIRNIRCSFHVI